MIGGVKVSLNPDRLTLRPGEAGDFEVTISNTSQAVEHYSTSIVGLPDEYSQCQPEVVKLRPGESGSVLVRTTLPEKAGPDSGLYTLGVLVRSPYQRQVSRCEELRLDILPASALAIEAQPEVGTGGSSATFMLTVTNQGNTALNVALSGIDREGEVDFTFRPRSLELEPGESKEAKLITRAAVPWTGQEARRMLTVRATAGPEMSAERALSFVQRVRLKGGLLRTVGMATGVAAIAGATLGGAVLVRNGFRLPFNPPPPPQAAPVTTPPTTPTTEPPKSPTSTGTGSPSSTPSASAVPGQVVVDFNKMPDGTPMVSNKVITGDLYKDKGVMLSADTDKAAPACREANHVALRYTKAIGGFLTSSTETYPDRCNTQPVRITFTKPVRGVRIGYYGTGAAYLVTAELSSGSLVSGPAPSENGKIRTALLENLPPGATIKSVTFGPANPDATAQEAGVYITKITFNSAG
jgi:hypothetical protein